LTTKLRISEKSLKEAEKWIVIKNIKMSEMDDKIIALEDECLEKGKLIDDELILKNAAE